MQVRRAPEKRVRQVSTGVALRSYGGDTSAVQPGSFVPTASRWITPNNCTSIAFDIRTRQRAVPPPRGDTGCNDSMRLYRAGARRSCMLAAIRSAAVLGIDAYDITVEVDVAPGLPQWVIVGLPASTVKESRERVSAALINSGFSVPPRRITVNLAPAGRATPYQERRESGECGA